jgi:hypothetical protein
MRVIPTLLSGIMHHNEHIARSIAKECVLRYDANPTPHLHHRLSVLALDREHGNGTREWLDDFLNGSSREDLGKAFWETIGPLKFLSVNEVCIEGEHALLKARGGRKLNKSLNYLSVQLRMPSLRMALHENPTEFLALTDVSRSVTPPRATIKSTLVKLGLGGHPTVAQSTSVPLKLARCCVYRCDHDSMDLPLARARGEVAKARKQAARAESTRPAPELSQDAFMEQAQSHVDILLRSAAWDHVRGLAEVGDYLSVPRSLEVRAFETLSHRLRPLGQPPEGEALGFEPDSALARGHDADAEPEPKECVYQMVRSRPGQHICVKPAPGVSRWLTVRVLSDRSAGLAAQLVWGRFTGGRGVVEAARLY